MHNKLQDCYYALHQWLEGRPSIPEYYKVTIIIRGSRIIDVNIRNLADALEPTDRLLAGFTEKRKQKWSKNIFTMIINKYQEKHELAQGIKLEELTIEKFFELYPTQASFGWTPSIGPMCIGMLKEILADAGIDWPKGTVEDGRRAEREIQAKRRQALAKPR